MNPYSFILIALGGILIIIGIHGSQHDVMNAFRGTKQGQTNKALGK